MIDLQFDFYFLDCCKEPIIIDSLVHPHGFLKVPQLYEKLNNTKHLNRKIECLYKFYGKPGERIQLFYEDFDLYYPYDIQKFNKIEFVCRSISNALSTKLFIKLISFFFSL